VWRKIVLDMTGYYTVEKDAEASSKAGGKFLSSIKYVSPDFRFL
jgi:hypothetical protein